MAATSAVEHTYGGRRNNSGRKKEYEGSNNAQKVWNNKNKRIYLSMTIFESWKDAKIVAGYGLCSDSDFAAHLLSLEYRRRSNIPRQRLLPEEHHANIEIDEGSHAESLPSQSPQSSTPCKIDNLPLTKYIAESPIIVNTDSERRHDIQEVADQDVEMVNDMNCGIPEPDISLLRSSRLERLDTSSKLNASLFTDDEGGTQSSCESEEESSQSCLLQSAIATINAHREIEEKHSEDDDSNSSSTDMDYSNLDDDMEEIRRNGAEHALTNVHYMAESASDQQPMSSIPSFYHLSSIEMSSTDDELEDEVSYQPWYNPISTETDTLPNPNTANSIPYGPHPKLSRGEELYNVQKELRMVKERKVICSLELILPIFQAHCQMPGCPNIPSVTYHVIGTTLVIHSLCLSGHKYSFYSSHELNEGVYVNNLQAAASIFLSGNNYAKIKRMASFYGLEFISKSTYYRFQRLYLVPEVKEWWSWMRRELLCEFAGKDLIVGGDGQCDSPGFNAKNLCYFMVEDTTNYIIHIEIMDKRHVGLSSTNMEREAVKRSLEQLGEDHVKVAEFVTDASTSIKALLETQFKNIVHSLDVWHKSKSIKKCLEKLGKPKAMRKIKDWSSHIVRHFWYCSSECRKDESTSDEDALKVMKNMWIGLLHHVCNQHTWLGGECHHEDGDHNESLQWFDRRDKDFIELQKVILNPVLLASFTYYTCFRHTGGIECANSLSLIYTPKRMSFSYQVYKARKQLTAIDWNYHVNLPQANTNAGQEHITRKYNARTRQWDVKVIKVAKGYDYIPLLISRILKHRLNDVESITRNVPLNESDPALIAPTIAHIPPPSIKEIIQRRSRFTKKDKSSS